jgi:DNA-binding NarL/FixJ family response regulator
MALVDLSLGSDDALQLVTELCARDVRVLVCSTHEEPGYITKREARRELAHTVRDLLEGWMLISPRAAEGLR